MRVGRRRVGTGGWAAWDQLNRYGYDLTERLRGHPDPLVSRPEVTRRITAALMRSEGNSVALVGPVGVGKRSAIRAFAQELAAASGPAGLAGQQVFWIDAARLVAGARYRGDLEGRVSRLATEAAAGARRLIVALDNAHLLLAGEQGGAGAALSELVACGGWILPVLPRQASALVDAVPGWESMVETIGLPEWSEEMAARAVACRLPLLQRHHQVSYGEDHDEVGLLAVRLARRFLPGALPGAAVDLLDQGAARARIGGRDVVGRDALLSAVADQTGLPLAGLDAAAPGGSGAERWLAVEQALSTRVVGQPQAIRAVSAALRRARAGIGDSRRPLGSFLFVGATGVGKTELARAIAEFLFGDEEALVRVDMSEYMERHSVARLIGAPPGYVGFDLPGQLTDPVRRRPFSVVLFDEAEKAHPDVLNLLLQVLEDGRLTDGYGRTVDFRHTVIVLTSNAGSDEARGAGNEAGSILLEAARRLLRPELINRLDDVVLFDPLALESLEAIVDLQVARASARLAGWGVQVRLAPGARRALAEAGYDPEHGARPLRRLIDREVLDPIATALLTGAPVESAVQGVVIERPKPARDSSPPQLAGDQETAMGAARSE